MQRTSLAGRHLAAVLLPMILLVSALAGVDRASAAEGDYTHVHYYNVGQADDRWGPTEMYGDFRIGRCGCQLATYTGMLWRHLHAAPGAYGPMPLSPAPYFPTIVHDYVVQPFSVGGFGWARRFSVASHESSIVSPTYLDQWLRRPNADYGNVANWGYQDKSGKRIGCGSPVSPWAMEALLVPPAVTFPTPDGPKTVQVGGTGIAVDMYSGFDEGVVRRNLARGEPTIIGRQYSNGSGGHYQVIVGWNHKEQRFMYRDPVDPTGTALLRMAGSSDEYQQWLGEIVETVDTRPSFGRQPHLVLQDDPSPIELSAVLPDGTQVGYDAATGERVTIPGNYMYELHTTGPADGTTEPSVDPIRGLMTTNNPIGVTRTTITGTGTGTYEVDIFDLDADGGRTDLGSVGGAIAEGQEIKHEVTYDEDGVVDAVQVDNFTPDPDVADVEAVAGEPVLLDATGSFDVDGEVVAWSWDLGDGSTAAGEQVTHTFDAPGTYAVELTVADEQGATRTEVVELEVAPSELEAPVVALDVDPETGWSTGDVTVDVTATDTGSGVTAVTTSATGADEQAETTTPGASASVVVDVEGRTTVRAVATDRMGNVAGAELVEVGVDRTAPAAVVRTPAAGQPASSLAVLGGTATDALSGVAEVEAQVRRPDGRTWDGSTWVHDDSWLPAEGTNAWAVVGGLPTGADLPDGDYEVRARATDVAGNAGDPSSPIVVEVRGAATGLPVVELQPGVDRDSTGEDVGVDGRAVGWLSPLALADPLPVGWTAAGEPNPLPLAAGRTGARPVALNASGDGAGWVVSSQNHVEAAMWVDGEVVPLGTYVTGGQSVGRDVNDAGVVVGSSTYLQGRLPQRAARFAGGDVALLPDLGGSSSEATASNEAGVVVGWSYLPNGGTQRAFVIPSGGQAAQPLPALPIPENPDALAANIAYDVNDAGTIVGSDTGRAVRWEDGEVVDLGDGEAFAVDEDGTAVGVTYTDDGMRAMVWEGTQGTDLNDLVDAGSGWVLERAEGISDDGRYVTGSGTLHGEPRGFVVDLAASSGGGNDTTPPSTTATAASGWTAGPVEVELQATDVGSGVARIVTNLGDVQGDAGSVVVDAEGESTVVYAAVDRAGNMEIPRSVLVRVDRIAPVATVSAPAPGWHPGPVVLDVDGHDTGSGVAALRVRIDGGPAVEVQPGPFEVAAEGEHVVEVVAIDHAGNTSAPATTTVAVDGDGPVVTFVEPETGATVPVGTPVVAVAEDAGSGLSSLELAIVAGEDREPFAVGGVLAHPGEVVVEATAVDLAGNATTATLAVEVVDPDAQPLPELDGLPPVADAGGPYQLAVLEEGLLDGTGSTDPDGDELTYEWFLNGAELAEGPTVPFGFADPGTYTLTLVVSDGSWSSVDMTSVEIVEGGPAGDPVVSIDVEPADGSAGWHRHAPVAATVSATASNPVTGVECTGGAVGEVTLAGTTATAAVAATGGDLTCTATDAAGNVGTATVGVLVDTTAPVVSGAVSPQPVVLGGPVSASASATDSGSGVAGDASCGPVSSATIGLRTVTCSATDVAGNVGSATVQYRVGYGFQGFEHPVDMGIVNVANAGRAIPLKWRLVDAAGRPVTGVRTVSVTSVVTSCAGGSTPTDAVEEYATGSSGLQDLGDGRYQFNWNTPRSYAGQCRTVRVDAGDGIVHTAQFRFR